MPKPRKKSSRRSDPATKGDLQDMAKILRSDIATTAKSLRKETKSDIDTTEKTLRSYINTTAATLRTEVKSDIDTTEKTLRAYIDTTAATLRTEVKSDMSAMEYRILEQMALMFEHHRHEIIGATKDAVDSLDTRVTRLERHAGFATPA